MANNWAIVVGINKYEFTENPPLKFAVPDALAIREFLVNEAGFDADQVLLCGDAVESDWKAGRSNLLKLLIHKLPRGKKIDNLWFFFAGHGCAGNDGFDYLMPMDCYPAEFQKTAISIESVMGWLRECEAVNTVLILDMCRPIYSGQRGERPLMNHEFVLLPNSARGRQVLLPYFPAIVVRFPLKFQT
jgi:uncharacterized caspase-like protein